MDGLADFSKGELNTGLPVEFTVLEEMPLWKTREQITHSSMMEDFPLS